MKITVKSYHAVASWRWELKPKTEAAAAEQPAEEQEEEDEEEDVCGICRVEFEGCCPKCKVPGDDCPLSTAKKSLYATLRSY